MIIVIDTETGGLEPGKSALLSISACHYEDTRNTFNVYISPDPSLEITEEAAKVNGYTPELWEKRGAIPLREALYRFKNWMPRSGNSPLAHNASFDRDFINAAEKQTGFNTYLQRRWRCSMIAFMFTNDVLSLNPPDFKLETLARLAGHWKEDFARGEHQSIEDVTACAAGYKWLATKCKQINPAGANEALFLEEGLRMRDEMAKLKIDKQKSDLAMMSAMELLTDLRWAQDFGRSREAAKQEVLAEVESKSERMRVLGAAM